MRASVWNLSPAAHTPHSLHGEGRAWVEKNCYVDVWIEVLHAQRLDPMAMLPFTVAVDFEGDQWTFFKPPHRDLADLYGVDVQELNVWRPLLQHALSHLGEGKLIFTEADAYCLPDTQGTTYRAQHVKTTIVLESIDTEARRLGYFHNASYGALEGADFTSLFRMDSPPDPSFLPLFAEIVRVDRVRRLEPSELARRSVDLLRQHLARRPAQNPVSRFKQRFVKDVEWLSSADLALYHAYAFATLRQCGANFELTSLYLKWLDEADGEGGGRRGDALADAAAEFDKISAFAKALVLKGARAVTTKKVADFSPLLGGMEESWQSGMDLLDARFGSPGGEG